MISQEFIFIQTSVMIFKNCDALPNRGWFGRSDNNCYRDQFCNWINGSMCVHTFYTSDLSGKETVDLLQDYTNECVLKIGFIYATVNDISDA